MSLCLAYVLDTGSHVLWFGLELNRATTALFLPSARVTGMHHYAGSQFYFSTIFGQRLQFALATRIIYPFFRAVEIFPGHCLSFLMAKYLSHNRN